MPVSNLPVLCSSQGNGNSDAITLSRSNAVNREGSIYVGGTFDGATVKVQASPKVSGDTADDWFDVTGGSFTSKGLKEVALTACRIRVNVSGGSGSESINVWYG
jgi:hypothetical protein